MAIGTMRLAVHDMFAAVDNSTIGGSMHVRVWSIKFQVLAHADGSSQYHDYNQKGDH
jgi:hypothetical protein